jgi:hypothetical protein
MVSPIFRKRKVLPFDSECYKEFVTEALAEDELIEDFDEVEPDLLEGETE